MIRSPFPYGCLALIFFAGLLLFPVFLADVFLSTLGKLGLSPSMAFVAALGIFAGGLVNVPVRRIERDAAVTLQPVTLFGLGHVFYRQALEHQYTIIAVNIGGCVIPVLLAAYELTRVAGLGLGLLLGCLACVAINVAVCFWLARPVPGVGIAMPSLVPGLVAALCAFFLAPGFSPPVAFIAGVLGPLVGADLLHLGDIRAIAANVASIGGAGTFDGIVISGLIATILS